MPAPTRERILDHARVVVAMGGRPTVSDFARAAGVSRASFYRSFRSKDALLKALERTPEPAARDRILETARDMVGAHGLAAVSIDELADRAGVSRATVYRLFPGKPALFSALVHAYSPLDPVLEVLDRMQAEPPDRVMPEIARTAYRAIAGEGDRTGLLSSLFFEVANLSADAEEAIRDALLRVVGGLAAYLTAQMQAGRLRRMHPVLALQAFIGPVFFHVTTRRAAGAVLGIDFDGEQAVTELAQLWLRAMAAEEEGR